MVGTCKDMCPADEVAERTRVGDIHVLEKNPENDADTSLMIKDHYTTATEPIKQPDHLRTKKGISKSMDRLRTVMDRSDVAFDIRASFICSRFYAIWDDITTQDFTDMFSVVVLEEIVRFLLVADFEVSRLEQEGALGQQNLYNAEFGIQLMLQCFETLSTLYDVLRNTEGGLPCPNEFEFRLYLTLFHMSRLRSPNMMEDDSEVESLFQNLPEELRERNDGKLQMLIALRDAAKQEDLALLVRITQQMDFFEYALGRKIVEHFREIKLCEFFTNLRQTDPRGSFARVPLYQFCNMFCLEHSIATKYATLYGLSTHIESGFHSFICMTNGLLLPKRENFVPIARDITRWGFITNDVKISDFVVQRPTTMENLAQNFTRSQLVWPSYVEALNQWRELSLMQNVPENRAIIDHLFHSQTRNRLHAMNQPT